VLDGVSSFATYRFNAANDIIADAAAICRVTRRDKGRIVGNVRMRSPSGEAGDFGDCSCATSAISDLGLLGGLQVLIEEGQFSLVSILAVVTLLESVSFVRIGVILVGLAG
jgi:hypothetical protein